MVFFQLVKKVESKFRFLLISFCAFSFLYCIVDSGISRYIEEINIKDTSSLAIMAFISVLIGFFIKYELLEFFDDDWDWTATNTFEKIQNEFICLMGVGVLYYFSLVGAMVLFFPSFEHIMINSVPLYNILFAGVSVLMYGIYRLTIIKF